MSSIQYNELAEMLLRLGHGDEAAAFHGALCGALCREPAEAINPDDFLDDAVPVAMADARSRIVLWQLRDETAEALEDQDFDFAPLLPDDDADLGERAQALSAWCGGFLFGLSGRVRLDLAACSEEVREVVEDFTQLTRAALDRGSDEEVEENAYAELIEYVRAGAQLVYLELRPNKPEEPRERSTLH